ncbi:hypothetical protein CAOG_06259 [Capsaspora owczarzaki ATCC 30864]|uniref:Peroxisomal assembly protein PEX3 n=1 Tax=Capsaspora owczarzaki (strain ATCC 30864) TaxID=595528 RepID=A0A0D2UL81_CAPO3|nr:hypothetical protein CAOG_06259 [Capsaspora owczarzaki ATCC 30864]KJE95856.1 hypothetical protein CAOG_006259 [Capsaspora owczarzaki ATCC 30864]|eukprot:XP_004345008.1 hypothetical protein CAOG_06259 [Capsaspora owczarzaki ATCC 30864]
MFAATAAFFRRHRRKLLITAGVLGGVYFAGRHLLSRLADERDKELAERLAHARMKQHFESNQKTCTTTALSLITTLRERLLLALDTDELTAQLRRGSPDKLALWERLKVVSFTRAVAAIYAVCCLVALLRVQLNVMGRYMYLDSVDKQNRANGSGNGNANAGGTGADPTNQANNGARAAGASAMHVSPYVQRLYLCLVHFLLSDGLELLIADVERCVQAQIGEIPLKKQLTHAGLCGVVDHLRITLDQNIIQDGDITRYLLPSLDKQDTFMRDAFVQTNAPSAAAAAAGGARIAPDDMRPLSVLVNETRRVLDTEPFAVVLTAALDAGFEVLSDGLLPVFAGSSPSSTTINNINNNNNNDGSGSTSNGAASSSSPSRASGSSAPASLSDSFSADAEIASIPLAKIIPFVNAQVHSIFQVPQNKLLSRLATLPLLDQFSAVIYAAFDGNTEDQLNTTFDAPDTSRIA